MNRKLLLVVVALAALAAVGIVAMLAADAAPGAGAPTAAAHRADKPSAALPTFRDEAPAPERAPQTLQAAPGAVEPGAAPAEPQAARPAGPTRTIAGSVLRASDGTPIEGVDLSIRTHAPQPTPLPKDVHVEADEWVIDVTAKSA